MITDFPVLICLYSASSSPRSVHLPPFIAVLARKIICWLRKPETEFSIDERNLARYRFVSVLMALFSRCRCFLLSFAERKNQPLQIFAQCPCKAWFMLYLTIFTNANTFWFLLLQYTWNKAKSNGHWTKDHEEAVSHHFIPLQQSYYSQWPTVINDTK